MCSSLWMPLQNSLIYLCIIHHACGYCQLLTRKRRKYSSLLSPSHNEMLAPSFNVVHFTRMFWIVTSATGISLFYSPYVIDCSIQHQLSGLISAIRIEMLAQSFYINQENDMSLSANSESSQCQNGGGNRRSYRVGEAVTGISAAGNSGK